MIIKDYHTFNKWIHRMDYISRTEHYYYIKK